MLHASIGFQMLENTRKVAICTSGPKIHQVAVAGVPPAPRLGAGFQHRNYAHPGLEFGGKRLVAWRGRLGPGGLVGGGAFQRWNSDIGGRIAAQCSVHVKPPGGPISDWAGRWQRLPGNLGTLMQVVVCRWSGPNPKPYQQRPLCGRHWGLTPQRSEKEQAAERSTSYAARPP